MPEDVILHDSLGDFLRAIGHEIEQEVEFTIHRLEKIHPDPSESPVFRTNYYTIVLIESGKGSYKLGGDQFDIGDNCLYFTNPGHLKSFKSEQTNTGFLMTFSEAFLKTFVHQEVFETFPFLLAEVVAPAFPDKDLFEAYQDILNRIWKESRSDANLKYQIIGSYLVILLLKIKENHWQDFNPQAGSDRGTQIAREFQRSLEKFFRQIDQFDEIPRGTDFAEEQQLHPSYFNTLIKSKTGKTVNTWIQEKLVAESRALLSGTDLSIKEIAFKLKFKDPSHFSKLFKNQTGQSPNEFRTENN